MCPFKKLIECIRNCWKGKNTAQDESKSEEPESEFQSALTQLKQHAAIDIMTPRADIEAIPSTHSFEQLIQAFQEAGHSRLPVYNDTLDSVYGFIHVKDLLPHILKPESFILGKFIRKVLFVSPAMRLDELLLEMQQSQTHMAIIIDEYGGVDGLITIEDILEELVGDIRDEHEEDEGPLLVKNNEHTYIASGKAPLEQLEKEVNQKLPELEDVDIETVGGYVAGLAGGLPKSAEMIEEPETKFKFEVIQVSPRTVDRVIIHLPKK